jgi:hypothetical protein
VLLHLSVNGYCPREMEIHQGHSSGEDRRYNN